MWVGKPGVTARGEHHIPFLSASEMLWLMSKSVASRVSEMAQRVRALATKLTTPEFSPWDPHGRRRELTCCP